MFFPITALLFIKDFTILVKMNEYGVYAIYSYVILIFYVFFTNLENLEKASDINLFSFEIGEISGTAALAFTIHTTFPPVLKCNKR